MTENKGDLISREALKENEPHYDEEGYRIFYESEIDNAPTVDIPNYGGQIVPDMLQGWRYAEIPQGEWIEGWDGYFETLDCSLCGYVRNERHLRLNFCPNCGASMKGGKE